MRKNERILVAVDPGNVQSGYVIVRYDRNTFEVTRILDKGKVDNDKLFPAIRYYAMTDFDFAIEMIASYGMAVGAEVFETCVFIGRCLEYVDNVQEEGDVRRVYRKDEKLCLCGSTKAKDANIMQALIDRYAYGQPNKGKGTKSNPGFFYGFSKDMWAAFAVAVTYLDTRREEAHKNA